MTNPEPNTITCRHCGSTQVRLSSHHSSGNSTRATYRCQSCKRHFRAGANTSRIPYLIAGATAFGLVVLGLAASLYTDNAADMEYQPRVDLSNPALMTKAHQAAKQGDPQAEYDLGWTYWQDAEYQQAFPWIKAAAKHGHIEAEYLLGMAYLNGRGTVQNYRSAQEQFAKSAAHNHLEAQFRLGVLYRDGLATLPNKEAAYVWLNIAAARGHEDALQYRDRLTAAMTTAEITRAQEASAQTLAKLSSMAKTP